MSIIIQTPHCIVCNLFLIPSTVSLSHCMWCIFILLSGNALTLIALSILSDQQHLTTPRNVPLASRSGITFTPCLGVLQGSCRCLPDVTISYTTSIPPPPPPNTPNIPCKQTSARLYSAPSAQRAGNIRNM